MTSKSRWQYRQSGAVPVLDGKVILVTTRNSGRWIIPKGIVERDMTPHDSAAKEAFEEAGVLGSVTDEELGRYRYSKWGGTCIVRVYPLYVEELLAEWEDMHVRKRRVVTPREALEMVSHRQLARILAAFFKRLD